MNRSNTLSLLCLPLSLSLLACAGCMSPAWHRSKADKKANKAIASAQERGLGKREEIDLSSPADTLRRRLLLDENLPHSGPESLGVRDIPDSEYWQASRHLEAAESVTNMTAPHMINLMQALQIAARNSRRYRDEKDDLFRASLNLDLESKEFRTVFSAIMSSKYEQDNSRKDGGSDSADKASQSSDNGSVSSALQSGTVAASRKLLNGVELSGRIVVDLVQLLTQETASAVGLSADATVSIPLLRGAGAKIAGAPLKQAEQNLLYQVYSFERFKREFAVSVSEGYLGVLRDKQQVRNAEENYKRLVAAARRARRLADAGRLPEFQLDQATQDELRARTRWVEARQSYASRLDSFKFTLGLPPDADIELDDAELKRLEDTIGLFAGGPGMEEQEEVVPPADAQIELQEPDNNAGGPLEMDPDSAIRLALDNRLDLRTARGRVEDAQRDVMVAADALRAEVTLLGKASVGERRSSASSAGSGDSDLDLGKGVLSGLLTVDLPLERTAERVHYRGALLDLEKAVRNLQELEDGIKLSVRQSLRDLLRAREGVLVQIRAVALAEKRVRSTDMFLQAGRAAVRDVLDSQEALLGAQNALTSAVVDYRNSELELQRDLGLLEVSRDGLWKEYKPGEGKK